MPSPSQCLGGPPESGLHEKTQRGQARIGEWNASHPQMTRPYTQIKGEKHEQTLCRS